MQLCYSLPNTATGDVLVLPICLHEAFEAREIPLTRWFILLDRNRFNTGTPLAPVFALHKRLWRLNEEHMEDVLTELCLVWA